MVAASQRLRQEPGCCEVCGRSLQFLLSSSLSDPECDFGLSSLSEAGSQRQEPTESWAGETEMGTV